MWSLIPEENLLSSTQTAALKIRVAEPCSSFQQVIRNRFYTISEVNRMVDFRRRSSGGKQSQPLWHH
jgi:hypothetical protein